MTKTKKRPTAIEVFPIESQVKFRQNERPAIVKSISITDRIQYEVTYWVADDKKVIWVDAFEIESAAPKAEKLTIGFVQ